MDTKERPVSSSLIERVAERVEARAMESVDDPDPELNKTIAELRVKLDIRTWMLRFALGALFFAGSVCITLLITLLTLLL